MRVVRAFVSFVVVATTGFVIGWMLLPAQPQIQVENGTEKKPPNPEPERSQSRLERATISRTRRSERRVAPFTTLLPVPVVASLTETEPAVLKKTAAVQQQVAEPKQDAPPQGEATATGAAMAVAEPAATPKAAPAVPEAQKPARDTSIPEAKKRDDVASLQQAAEKRQQNRLRLPYARATQPLPGDRTARPSSPSRRESSRFRRPVPENAGVLKTATKTVYLAGVTALNQDATCELPTGESWPCGRIGTLALRRLIRSRSIVCDIIEHRDENSVLAQCKVARVDINRWVIRNGWARPADGSARKFVGALEIAQAEKKGQWSDVSPIGN
ncbi:MAG: thermonuclease family protein [Hyphomicrobiales bacterium]|nr:thermonuclease family protein [Hyphomicrobiales bacterium]